MKFEKEIDHLYEQGIIDSATRDRLKAYYADSKESSQNRLLTVFAVLGSVLMGLGLILMIAHNWDDLSRSIQTICAFVPLIVSQALCFFSLLKKPESTAWRESSAAALFLSFGAEMSLVGQIYHLDPNLEDFLLTWSAVSLPLIYLLRSNIFALLWIPVAVWYGCLVSYEVEDEIGRMTYWMMMFSFIPYVYDLSKNDKHRIAFIWLNWLFVIALLITAGSLSNGAGQRAMIVYVLLASSLMLLGEKQFFKEKPLYSNPFLFLGTTTMIILALMSTSGDVWKGVLQDSSTHRFSWASFAALIALISFLVWQIYDVWKSAAWKNLHPLIYLCAPMLILILSALPEAYLWMNFFLLLNAVYLIYTAAREHHLGRLNLGLTIVSMLMLLRFFDSEWSFVQRGIVFLLCGSGFLAGNIYILKRRKA